MRNPTSERRLQKSRLSGIRTLCSPSPLPSPSGPSGRGSIVGSAFDNPSRLELLQRRSLVLPLPEGEGRGEGEQIVRIPEWCDFCNRLSAFGFLSDFGIRHSDFGGSFDRLLGFSWDLGFGVFTIQSIIEGTR